MVFKYFSSHLLLWSKKHYLVVLRDVCFQLFIYLFTEKRLEYSTYVNRQGKFPWSIADNFTVWKFNYFVTSVLVTNLKQLGAIAEYNYTHVTNFLVNYFKKLNQQPLVETTLILKSEKFVKILGSKK